MDKATKPHIGWSSRWRAWEVRLPARGGSLATGVVFCTIGGLANNWRRFGLQGGLGRKASRRRAGDGA